MNTITNNLIFPVLAGSGADKAPTDNYDPSLKIFEQMVDNIVAKSLKDSKAEHQAAIEKAKLEAEQQDKVAFLMGAVHQAEIELSGVSSSPAPPLNASDPASPVPQAKLDFQESQVLYWKAKLVQANIPDGTTGLF